MIHDSYTMILAFGGFIGAIILAAFVFLIVSTWRRL